ncbi:MAG: cbb3-type cytochrome c oxidase subunit II, partial [Gammaproteobacteria bacterium]
GGRYTDKWHRAHLHNPRQVVPESNMPGFPWLEKRSLDTKLLANKIAVMRKLGVPYPPETESTLSALENQTELDALIAYLQNLGIHRKANATAASSLNTPSATVAHPQTSAPSIPERALSQHQQGEAL